VLPSVSDNQPTRSTDTFMNHIVKEIPIPADCSLQSHTHNADFADAFTVRIPLSDLTATQIYAAVARQTPVWVDSLMALRNQVASLFGLKHLGSLADVSRDLPARAEHDLQVGQRMGLFSFVSATPHELVVEDTDKHLTVQLSILKNTMDYQYDRLTLTTVVHIRNMLGRLYMLPVGPAHKLIAPAVLRQAPTAVAEAIAKAKNLATLNA
jgi:hypothetical protein